MARRKVGSRSSEEEALSPIETTNSLPGTLAIEREPFEQRLESIGQLVIGIAHDFNNQLAGIMGLSKLIQDQLKELGDHGPDDVLDQVFKDLEQIVKSTERAAALTTQLLGAVEGFTKAPTSAAQQQTDE